KKKNSTELCFGCKAPKDSKTIKEKKGHQNCSSTEDVVFLVADSE
ncbi:hypothetical protein DBR06_SOUSAS3410042, partial [Sousa chinensis]